jgi:hypothetical protein
LLIAGRLAAKNNQILAFNKTLLPKLIEGAAGRAGSADIRFGGTLSVAQTSQRWSK